MKFFFLLFFIPFLSFGLSVPEISLSETLDEKKRGNEFLQLIWNTNLVIDDIEMATYLNNIGNELASHSENPYKHFGFFLLKNSNINAFAGPYGYIGVYAGMLLSSDSEAELAAVLAHEISHITQNHLVRFEKKSSKQSYLIAAGVLAAALTKNNKASEAIVTSTIAATMQQNINFTREHEWEADRIGIGILKKSNFNPKGMANFFSKLKSGSNAKEFLRTHPLSINRISDSIQRVARETGNYRPDSFAYKTIKARLYYDKNKRIKLVKGKQINHYMQSYKAFEEQNYQKAKQHINKLLAINDDKPSNILAGRIASKLGNIELAQQYFNKNTDESSVYYAANTYLDNQQPQQGIAILKPFLRANTGNYASYKLLSLLYLKQGKFDRSHIQSAKALVVQGKLEKAIKQYERAKTLTSSQDLYDIINVKISDLKQTLNLYKD